MTASIEKSDYISAEVISREALSIDERDPDLLYLRAKALLKLNRVDEERSAFIQSKDEDVCPLRALSPIRDIVMEVAKTENTVLLILLILISTVSFSGS